MTASKYADCVHKQPVGKLERDGKVIFDGLIGTPDLLGTKVQLLYSIVTEAHVNEAKPHIHDFPIVMSFIGSDWRNINDFDAEIEFYIGGEKQVITTTAMVSVPAGTPHCPLIFKRIGKPVVFMEVMLTERYVRREVEMKLD